MTTRLLPAARFAIALAASTTVLGASALAGAHTLPASHRRAPVLPDHVTVARSVAFPQDRFQNNTPFAAVITSPVLSRRLYLVLSHLPAAGKGMISCPMDMGITYRIAFWRGRARVATANVGATGCMSVTWKGANGLRHEARAIPTGAGARFWAVLAKGIGRPVSALEGPGAPLPAKGTTKAKR
jgi:hypothetical protein